MFSDCSQYFMCRESLSESEYIPYGWRPSFLHVLAILIAISPLFAIRTFLLLLAIMKRIFRILKNLSHLHRTATKSIRVLLLYRITDLLFTAIQFLILI